MENKTIFKIPLIKYSIDNWDLKKEELTKVITQLKFNSVHKFISSRNIKEYIFFDDVFVKILNQEFLDIEKEIGKEIKEINSWVVQYKKYGEHIIHNHASTGLGGVLYFDYDEREHPSTKYLMPMNDIFNDTSLIYEEKVKEGDIVITPAALHHFCPCNTSDKPRTIIGLDIKF